MAIAANKITKAEWETAAFVLRNDTECLWRMAWCCTMAYFAVCRLDDVWKKECERMGLVRSRYDRWHFDTIARSVRQAAFMYCDVPVWRCMPKLTSADGKMCIQLRTGPKGAASVVAWETKDPDTPWFVAMRGQVYLFPYTNGYRRSPPSRGHLSAVHDLLDAGYKPPEATTDRKTSKTRSTTHNKSGFCKTISDVKASLDRLPTLRIPGLLPLQ